MLQDANVDKVERSEFSNSARDTFKFVLNNNNYNFTREGEDLILESPDVIEFFRNVVQPFLVEVRKNDRPQSTSAETAGQGGSNPVTQAVTPNWMPEGDPVDIIDMVPPEPSSLPVASIADRYARSMLKCLAGYPLHEPQPLSELSVEYLRNGVNVGDVGFVRGNGFFDFLFNICPSKNDLINPPNLPDGFSLEAADQSETRVVLRKTSFFPSSVKQTASGEYICEESEGAILELPEGAIEEEAMNIRPFEKLAARHGVQWYEYTMTRGRKISNGSLYLITSFVKCSQWGIAVFDRKCGPGQGLRFDKKISLPFRKSTGKYHWKGSHAFHTKVANHLDVQNQCVFLRGYKIMLRQDIFDNLYNDQPGPTMSTPLAGSSRMTRQRATRIRGGGGTDPNSKTLPGRDLLSRITMSNDMKSDEVVLHSNFNSSLAHPSDFINATLLSHNPNAKIALTHDDVWCNLLQGNFPKLNYQALINVAQAYRSKLDEYDCISLQRMSNSRDVIKVGYRPIQGSHTPALPPLITLEGDKTYVPADLYADISLTLPHELLERILLLLDVKYMLSCRLVNRAFNEIVQSSTSLQYILACKAAGVTDNPLSPLSYTERLEALKEREEAWRTLKPAFETTIRVNHQPSGIYDLKAGNYLLGDSDQKNLHCCHLPSSPEDKPQWVQIRGHSPEQSWSGRLLEIGMSVYEHDLIVKVISSEVGNQLDMQPHSLDLVLLKFSTGEYHQSARHPRIHVQRSSSAQPWIGCEIAGDTIALIVHHDADLGLPDRLFIFDWMTGQKRLQHEADIDAYSHLVFISPEVLLVPNLILFHLELWHIHPSHRDAEPPVQILCLNMPALSPGYGVGTILCYGRFDPFLHSMPYFPSRPFFPSPENSIISINLCLLSYGRVFYTLIIHRHGILDTIQRWTSSPLCEQHRDRPMWLTNAGTVREIADPDDESVRLWTESYLKMREPHPIFGSTGFPTFTPSPSSTFQYSFLQVEWAAWGPPFTRWFQTEVPLVNVTGQRYAFLAPKPLGLTTRVNVADFNQHNVRRNAKNMALQRLGEGIDNPDNSNSDSELESDSEEDGVDLEILNHDDVFSEDVYMGLKCVIYHAQDGSDFDRVLIDEERLLGLKVNREGKVESVKVLYFG